jgi:hypothetical protein
MLASVFLAVLTVFACGTLLVGILRPRAFVVVQHKIGLDRVNAAWRFLGPLGLLAAELLLGMFTIGTVYQIYIIFIQHPDAIITQEARNVLSLALLLSARQFVVWEIRKHFFLSIDGVFNTKIAQYIRRVLVLIILGAFLR